MMGGGRMSFAYPDFPKDVLERGKLEPSAAAWPARPVRRSCATAAQRLRPARLRYLRADLQGRPRRGPRHHPGRGQHLPPVQRSHLRARLPGESRHSAFRRSHRGGPLPRGLRNPSRAEPAGRRVRLRVPGRNAVRSRVCINEHFDKHVPIQHLQRWVSRKGGGGRYGPPSRVPAPGHRQTRGGARRRSGGSFRAATLASLGYKVVVLFDRAPQAAEPLAPRSPPSDCRSGAAAGSG
jgi:hypothetical protein